LIGVDSQSEGAQCAGTTVEQSFPHPLFVSAVMTVSAWAFSATDSDGRSFAISCPSPPSGEVRGVIRCNSALAPARRLHDALPHD